MMSQSTVPPALNARLLNTSGWVHQPLLQPIPVQGPLQIVGVDVMELPVTKKGNKLLPKEVAICILCAGLKGKQAGQALVEEVVPVVGIPESLLSDRGTNLLSHLKNDVCKLLEIQKINTTAYHPACDGLVERFNEPLRQPSISMPLYVETNGTNISLEL